MAVSPTNSTSALATATSKDQSNPKGVLGKKDFLKLLLVELQYQDPTAPMDTEKILSQTSQLATLESSDNTNAALGKLSASLSSAQQFSIIAAIGKTADLGSNSIAHDKGASSIFEIYFPNDIKQGIVEIQNSNGSVVQTLNVGTNKAGVYSFTWDGSTPSGVDAEGGVYNISANYTDSSGKGQTTKLGTYPIEAVRFDKGNTLVKVGSSYVPLTNIKEVY